MTAPDILSLAAGITAVAVWAIYLGKTIHRTFAALDERRSFVAMGVVGLTAAVGALASAVYFAAKRNGFTVDENVLLLLGSMGRGALVMGGVIVLLHPSTALDRGKRH